PIELIVRDVDEKGRITGLGLSFEPTAPVARVPVFLSAGEIADRLGAFIRKWRKPAQVPVAESAANEAAEPEPAAQKAATES
ncbi:MAG: potassium/proton antiporter, partial [Mesorhizobium sp.]